MTSIPDIQSAIPHRNKMLLVDEVISVDEKQIVCQKTFREDEHFFDGHYPGNPIVPGVIFCECAAQTGAILISTLMTDASGTPVLTRMDDIRFKRIVKPGETIEIKVTLDDVVSTAYYLTAQVRCEGKLATRLSFACTLAPSA
jgi:3-hydroxyacyl-[acyl-carrier-protein] dehydratase